MASTPRQTGVLFTFSDTLRTKVKVLEKSTFQYLKSWDVIQDDEEDQMTLFEDHNPSPLTSDFNLRPET